MKYVNIFIYSIMLVYALTIAISMQAIMAEGNYNMTEQDAKQLIEMENKHLDWIFNETMKKCFGDPLPEKCTISDWFKFTQLWHESGAYADAAVVQIHLRNAGFDVKMSMSDKFKLVYKGYIA